MKKRDIIQGLLFSALTILSVFLIIKTFYLKEWETLTAAISLLIAVISLVISIRTFNKEEDSNIPDLHLTFDMTSRYSIIMLMLKNIGQKTAYDIELNWEIPIKNSKGKVIKFRYDENPDKIAVLQTNEEVRTLVDAPQNIFEKLTDDKLLYKVKTTFKDKSGTKYQKDFDLTLSHFRTSLLFEKEEVKTFYKLQKLPETMEKILKELKEIKDKMPGA